MPYFVTIFNFEAAILDISELYVYDILHFAFLDYLNKIGHFDSLRYGFGLYKCHSQYSKWRPSWNPIWRPYGTFFSLAPILKRFSAFFSFRVPNFMLCSQSPWFFHQSAQLFYSLSGKTSYRKISWSLEAARFGFKLFQSLWNLAGTSAALLPRCLSNFRAIRPLQHPISRLWDFTRFGGKTSYRLVSRGPGRNIQPSSPWRSL